MLLLTAGETSKKTINIVFEVFTTDTDLEEIEETVIEVTQTFDIPELKTTDVEIGTKEKLYESVFAYK